MQWTVAVVTIILAFLIANYNSVCGRSLADTEQGSQLVAEKKYLFERRSHQTRLPQYDYYEEDEDDEDVETNEDDNEVVASEEEQSELGTANFEQEDYNDDDDAEPEPKDHDSYAFMENDMFLKAVYNIL